MKKQIKKVKLDENQLPILDQFSDAELEQLVRFGKALHPGVTDFDEEVERELEKLEAEKARNIRK